MTQRYQLARFKRGKATSLAPSIIGSTKLPSAAGIDGDDEEEDHDRAVEREHLVVGVGPEDRLTAGEKLGADGERRHAAEEEGESAIEIRYMTPIRL